LKSLPPLNTLRAFESAGRLLSFNEAAVELHLTPSAVSHAIKSLESFLGQTLFRRLGRGVTLTAEGSIYLAPVRDALTRINTASAMLMQQTDNQPLTISAAPAMTIGWLMPRLARFQMAHPDIEVRMSSTPDVIDFARSDIDLAIRSGSGHWSGLNSHFLMSEELVVVYKPGLLTDTGKTISTPEDLLNVSLIHVMPTIGQWRSWLNAQGITHPDTERGPKFESSAVAVEAAVAGLGAVLIPKTFVEDHVRDGRLVLPFDVEATNHYDFYVVYPSERVDVPRIATFRDWILGEV